RGLARTRPRQVGAHARPAPSAFREQHLPPRSGRRTLSARCRIGSIPSSGRRRARAHRADVERLKGTRNGRPYVVASRNGVGIAYAVIGVRSPAPPITALIG